MSEAFARTLRSLDADRGRSWLLALAAGAALASLWVAWMVFGVVPVHAVSSDARIEAAGVPREVKTAIAGTVVSVDVGLGDRVHAGQILVSLDDASARASLDDARALQDSLSAQLDRLTTARVALTEAEQQGTEARGSAAAGARSEAEKAALASRQAADEATRAEDLATRGAISAQELSRARAEAERWALERRIREQMVRQLSSELVGAKQGGQVEIGRLDQELAELAGRLASARAGVEGAMLAVQRHRIVAPVDGTVGSLATRDEGAVLAVGDAVATVVPDGELHVVASFSPSAALGRVRPEQRAQMRLDGFPWTAYGSLPARVERVADEPATEGLQIGGIRVELSLQPGPDWRVPLQHGLPGQVEVEVDRLSPAALILRTVGGRTP